jgi:FKBP-type peptidyl-prolyl cis-trans isomerase 2
MRHATGALLALALAAAVPAAGAPDTGKESAVVSDGMKVTMEYTLTLPDKSVASTNVGEEGHAYVQGRQEMLPGLEKQLAGMKAGEKKHIDLKAADAYGPYDEKAKITVPRDRVPPEVQTGMDLQGPDGRPVKVLQVSEKEVVLDMNHPLAGKDLAFDVKILKVEKADDPPPAPPGEAPGSDEIPR